MKGQPSLENCARIVQLVDLLPAFLKKVLPIVAALGYDTMIAGRGYNKSAVNLIYR